MEKLKKLVKEAMDNLVEINEQAKDPRYLGYDQGRFDTYMIIYGWILDLEEESD